MTRLPATATLGPDSMPARVETSARRGLPRWDAVATSLACLLTLAAPAARAQLGVREIAGAPTYRELLRAGDVLLAYVQAAAGIPRM